MFEIECPYCGLREMTEFSCHGEAHIARPKNSLKLSDRDWGDYVFFRQNPKGWHRERWYHKDGCRKWFNVLRHTVTDEIAKTYKIGATWPEPPATIPLTLTKAQVIKHKSMKSS